MIPCFISTDATPRVIADPGTRTTTLRRPITGEEITLRRADYFGMPAYVEVEAPCDGVASIAKHQRADFFAEFWLRIASGDDVTVQGGRVVAP